jgi:hypothetical protein
MDTHFTKILFRVYSTFNDSFAISDLPLFIDFDTSLNTEQDFFSKHNW